MLDFVMSVFSGGVTGLLGVGIQRIFDWLNKREEIKAQESKQAHEVAMLRANAEVMAQEWAARTRVAEVEAAGKEAVADAQAFAASFGMEPQSYSVKVKPSKGQGWLLVALDFIRGIIRPGLTVYLCAITTLVYFQARDMLLSFRAQMDPIDAVDISKLVISTVLYLTTTCVLWWFGTRNKQSAPKVSP